MKLSDGVEWTLHACTMLAALPEGAALTGAALAEYHGVSESYLLKHLQAAARAGLLESLPGPRGGFRLARPAESITLLDVVEAVEGREPAFRCTEIRQRGPSCLDDKSAYAKRCVINATMLRAEAAWRAALRGQTLAELAAEVVRTADPRALEKGGAWLQSKVRR